MIAVGMFWLVLLQQILPPKCVVSLKESTQPEFCTRESLVDCLKNTPPHEVVTHFNIYLKLDVRHLDFEARCEQVAKACCGWALKGFPYDDRKTNLRIMQHMYGVLLELLVHVPMRRVKLSSCLWKLACTLSHVLDLHEMWGFAWKRSPLRVMLRAFSREVQSACLEKNFNLQGWRKYLKHVFCMVWRDVPENSAQYFVWASQQKVFYIGKANVRRNTADHLGVVARFKEHVLATFKNENLAHVAKRYRAWRNARPEELFMVVAAWHEEGNILSYEKFLIHHMQASIQDRVRSSSFKPHRFRPWPRFRSMTNLKQESDLNVSHELLERRGKRRSDICKGLPGVPDWVSSFNDLCAWQLSVFGRARSDVMRMMYAVERVAWLALFLSQKHARLNYQQLWDTGRARAIATGAWVFAGEFDHENAARAQSKLERFLNTSPLTSCKTFVIKVPTRCPRVLSKVKRQVFGILASVRKNSHWWSIMLSNKIRVVRAKTPVLSQLVPSCIQVARSHDVAELVGGDHELAESFDLRKDVVKSGLYWDIPLEHPNPKMQGIMQNQFVNMLKLYKLCHLHQEIQHVVADSSYTDVDDNQVFLEQFVREHVGDLLAVPVDKDPKRRVLMNRLGFLHRLREGYVHDDRFYTQKRQCDLETLAMYRQHIAHKFLPQRVARPKVFAAANCQYAYHTYKGKCLSGSGGLSCQKDHAHEREIVSDFHNPCKRHLRLVSRAVRLVKMLSGEHTWTLWKQSRLKPVLLHRVSLLKGDLSCVHCCPCGQKKENELSLIKIDAAQFFKAASLERGLARVQSLLQRVEEKGYDAVSVRKSARCAGQLCKSTKSTDQASQVVAFSTIRNTLKFILHDRYFSVGSVVMRRKGGWPMGGSFSEPGTLVDLNEELRILAEDSNKMCEIGWHFKNWTLTDLVSGLMHVDDAIVFSRIFCSCCLERGMKQLWPEDVGISLEETGPTVRMLQSYIHIRGVSVHIRPHNPNVSFALGFDPVQKIARLGPYLGEPFHAYQNLCQFLHGKLLAYNHLVQGDADSMFVYLGFLLLEIVRLNWPERFIRKALCSLPRRHVSPFISACRRTGRKLRHGHVHEIFNRDFLVEQVSVSPVERAVHSDMSKQWRPPHHGGQNWRNWNDRGRQNQPSDVNVSREVVDYVREESRRRAEEKQATEIQKHTQDTIMRMFGVGSLDATSQASSSGSADKSQPFEMLKWVAGRIMKRTSRGSDSEEKKEKKRKRKKTRSSSSTSSSESSLWAQAKKKQEKDKKKDKDKKDKKEKRKKEEKTKSTRPRSLTPVAASPEEKKNDLPKERRQELAKELKIEGKLTSEQLESEDWKSDLVHAAKKEDIQKLAERNGLQKSGSKYEIVERLVAYMLGK